MPLLGSFGAASARGLGMQSFVVVAGTTTFTSSGTFIIPNYNTLQVSARGGEGGDGGKTAFTGADDCVQGGNGTKGGNSSAIGGGISLTSIGGAGGNRASCPTTTFCRSGSAGSASTATSITYLIASGGLTIGSSVTVTVGQGGAGGNNANSSPCSGGNAPSGADTGYVTFTWT